MPPLEVRVGDCTLNKLTVNFPLPLKHIFVLLIQTMIRCPQYRRIILIHHLDLVAGYTGELHLVGQTECAWFIILVIAPFDLHILDMFITKTLVSAARALDHLNIRLVDFLKAAKTHCDIRRILG